MYIIYTYIYIYQDPTRAHYHAEMALPRALPLSQPCLQTMSSFTARTAATKQHHTASRPRFFVLMERSTKQRLGLSMQLSVSDNTVAGCLPNRPTVSHSIHHHSSNSSSRRQPPALAPLPQLPQPHRPSTSCDRHPQASKLTTAAPPCIHRMNTNDSSSQQQP